MRARSTSLLFVLTVTVGCTVGVSPTTVTAPHAASVTAVLATPPAVAAATPAPSPTAGASPTPTPNPYAGMPSNACGGFHLTIVNHRTSRVTVTVNGDRSFDVEAGESVAVAASLPPPYGLNLAVPWDVVITDAESGDRVFSATMSGPVDQKVTLSDTAPVQTPYSLTMEGC
jgi:hypothetical protein